MWSPEEVQTVNSACNVRVDWISPCEEVGLPKRQMKETINWGSYGAYLLHYQASHTVCNKHDRRLRKSRPVSYPPKLDCTTPGHSHSRSFSSWANCTDLPREPGQNRVWSESSVATWSSLSRSHSCGHGHVGSRPQRAAIPLARMLKGPRSRSMTSLSHRSDRVPGAVSYLCSRMSE